jgi:hypothetical protein
VALQPPGEGNCGQPEDPGELIVLEEAEEEEDPKAPESEPVIKEDPPEDQNPETKSEAPERQVVVSGPGASPAFDLPLLAPQTLPAAASASETNSGNAAAPPRYASAPPPPLPPDVGAWESGALLPIAEYLPLERQAAFERLVEEGERIRSELYRDDGFVAPGYYSSDLDSRYVDELIHRGLARVVLRLQGFDNLVLFEGSFSRPGRPFTAGNASGLRGFSERAIRLAPEDSRRFSQRFWESFLRRGTDGQPRCYLLLRYEIDCAILAAQVQAVRRSGLRLEDVRATEGRFEKVGSFPFRFVPLAVIDQEGRKIPVKPEQSPRT